MISHRLPNNKKENKYFKNENNSEINTKQSLVYINIKKKRERLYWLNWYNSNSRNKIIVNKKRVREREREKKRNEIILFICLVNKKQ